MSRIAGSMLAVALGLATAVALASCGGGGDAKLLPGTTAQEITENLESVRELAAEGECVSAQDAALQVSTEVEALRGIDAKLKEELEKGAAKLNEVVLTCTEETPVEDTISVPTERPVEKTKAEEKSEKEQEKAEKEAEKEQKEAEKEQEKAEKEAEKEQKDAEKEQEHEEAEGGEPSGGIGPGGTTEGGD